MKPCVVAVLDVGKTNKKLALYDASLACLAEARTQIGTSTWRGLEVEDTRAILDWARSSLSEFTRDFDIRAIATSAHGATFALLDEGGDLALPVISYASARGAEVQAEFYERFGKREELHRLTGTADIGFCNMAKVLYFIQTRLPDLWDRCAHGLFYGPYFGYAFSGIRGLEPTFIGNHTYFWDFARDRWSGIAESLGAPRLFGSRIRKPWDVLGPVRADWVERCGLPADCRVTVGIHDSNANYLPYLVKESGDFVLNSTGTWAVLMRGAKTATLSDEDVRDGIFFNLSAQGQPIRTSLAALGMDYETFRALAPDSNEIHIEKTIRERRVFLIPGVLPEGSPYRGQDARVIVDGQTFTLAELRSEFPTALRESPEEYVAALNLALASATATLLEQCGVCNGTTVFVDGGFAKNEVYCDLLAALCPAQNIALTDVTEGASFGAALTGWMCADGCGLDAIGQRFQIARKVVPRREYPGLDEYRRAYARVVGVEASV